MRNGGLAKWRNLRERKDETRGMSNRLRGRGFPGSRESEDERRRRKRRLVLRVPRGRGIRS